MFESMMVNDVELHMDSANQLAMRFMEDQNSLTEEEVFNLFCETFDVTETDAASFLNGHRFELES